MKKIIVMAVCTLCVLTAAAQNSYRRGTASKTSKASTEVSFGIRGALNVSNLKTGSGLWGTRVGYNIGVVADIPLYKRYFYLQPGLYLTQKGAKSSDGTYKDKANPTYLELPIMFSGRYDITRNVQIQGSFGPWFAAGLFGRYKESAAGWSDSHSLFNASSLQNTGFKRFDCGLAIGAGFVFSRKYYLGFQYDFGLYNMSPDKWGSTCKTRNCMIDIGYNF